MPLKNPGRMKNGRKIDKSAGDYKAIGMQNERIIFLDFGDNAVYNDNNDNSGGFGVLLYAANEVLFEKVRLSNLILEACLCGRPSNVTTGKRNYSQH
jgi:hypothetical protein